MSDLNGIDSQKVSPDGSSDGSSDGLAVCCLSYCDELFYATFEEDGAALELCQFHFDQLAR